MEESHLRPLEDVLVVSKAYIAHLPAAGLTLVATIIIFEVEVSYKK
jgi:hypothetical protein